MDLGFFFGGGEYINNYLFTFENNVETKFFNCGLKNYRIYKTEIKIEKTIYDRFDNSSFRVSDRGDDNFNFLL